MARAAARGLGELHAPPRPWFRFDEDKGVAQLTKLYDWYGGDLEQVVGSVLNYAARYAPELKRAMDAGSKPSLWWLDYDWGLNRKRNAP